jgi:proprotein convertase subtilisin/kexin type 5
MCTSTCSGPSKEDCDSIKPKYEIIIYILSIKTTLWIGSSIAGYILDLQTGQSLKVVKIQPTNIIQHQELENDDSPSIQKKRKPRRAKTTKGEKEIEVKKEQK